MWKKTLLGLVIFLTCLGALLINDTRLVVKSFAYDSLVQAYGRIQLRNQESKILYNPGLRKLPIDKKQAKIYANLPDMEKSYAQQISDFMESDGQLIVECSGLDGWHSCKEGSECLPRLRSKAYRVVIFDGGHHLPTLGLSPDIIIVPVFKGYAVHGYMQDGMKVAKVLEILKASHSQTILVTVSRWRLVKTEQSLKGISQEILSQLDFRTEEPEPLQFSCRPRVSKYGQRIFIYANTEFIHHPVRLTEYCRQLGLDGVQAVYIAFDYAAIQPAQAGVYVQGLQKRLGLTVEIINEPVKVSDLLLP